MSGTAGTNYPLASKTYVDEGLAGKEDKGTCLPKSEGTLLGGVFLQSRDGNATAQILRSDYESKFEGVDILTEVSNKDLGAVLSLRANSCADKSEAGSFHIRTGRNPRVLFLKGQPDGTLSWKGNEIVRIGQGNKKNFSIGASGASYRSPVTGKCVITGDLTGAHVNGGAVELINDITRDQMTAGVPANTGWMRGHVYVRKGDTVTIFYYNLDIAEAYWIEQ